jgi:hypothetical protein
VVRTDSTKPGILSPGTAFSIWGRDFGPASGCKGEASELCRVRVMLDGTPIDLQFVSDVLINARMPDAEPQQVMSRLTVVVEGRTSDPVEIRRKPDVAMIKLDGVARVEGPVWIHVELPGGEQVRYPVQTLPWEFGCDAVEVRKDGKLLDKIPVPDIRRGGMNGGISIPCQPNLGIPIRATNRLPIHLQYDFNEPGTYEMRLSHYGSRSRQPEDLRSQSAWTPIEVLEAVPRQPLPSPEFPEPIVTNFFPNLLSLRNDETLWTLLGNLYNGTAVVRGYAADALYYWPDSVIIPQLLQSLRSYGPVPEGISRLGSAVSDGWKSGAHAGRAHGCAQHSG